VTTYGSRRGATTGVRSAFMMLLSYRKDQRPGVLLK